MTNILRLREQEATSSKQNADFTISLNKNTTLQPGDSLVIKQTYLDTISAGGQMVELQDDVNITLSVGRYIINDRGDQTFPASAVRMRDYAPTIAPPTNPILTAGDGQAYFACRTNSTEVGDEKVLSFTYRPIKRTDHMVGGLDVSFEYDVVHTNPTQKKAWTFRIKREKAGLYKKDGREEVVNILVKGKSFTLKTDRDFIKAHGIDPDSFDVKYDAVAPAAGTDFLELDTKDFNMTIDAGIYTPTQLGEIITDKMIVLNSDGPIGNDLNGNVFPVNCPFLSTAVQDQIIAAAQTPASLACYCKADGTQLFRYNDIAKMKTDNEDRFIGANQIELSYDDAKKKMSFPILHFPQYVNETAQGNDALAGLVYEDHGIVGKYGGVVFTEMSPPEFWSRLGFTNVCVRPIQDLGALTTNGVAGFTADVRPLRVPFVEGINTTNGFESLDTPVQKSANFRQPNPAGSIATDATLPIHGNHVFQNDYQNEGYYYIELDLGVSQSLIGSYGVDGVYNSTKVHSIVGTYFQSNNFTSDSGAGSIAYTHPEGAAPLLINNIGVRILDCNGNIPDPNLIGNHNTIFLEHVKGQSN